MNTPDSIVTPQDINTQLKIYAPLGSELCKATTVGTLSVPLQEEVCRLFAQAGLSEEYLAIERRRSQDGEDLAIYGQDLTEDQRESAIKADDALEREAIKSLAHSVTDSVLRGKILETLRALDAIPAHVEGQILKNFAESLGAIQNPGMSAIWVPALAGLGAAAATYWWFGVWAAVVAAVVVAVYQARVDGVKRRLHEMMLQVQEEREAKEYERVSRKVQEAVSFWQ